MHRAGLHRNTAAPPSGESPGHLDRLRRHALGIPAAVGYRHGPRVMSNLRRWWVLARNPQANIQFKGPVYLGPGFSLHIPNGGTFVVGADVEFRRGFRAEIDGEGAILIGAGSRFTYSVLMQCSTLIDVGERCMFGQSTIVVDGQHRFRDLTKPMLDQGYEFQRIHVGDDAVVTTKCTVMSSIGERAFIGANSVVSRPVPPYTVAVGAPARPIDYFGPPGGEPPELLERSASETGS